MDGTTFLVVWPADRTLWEASRRSILFANDNGVVEVIDGELVALTGGGTDRRSHTHGDAWAESVHWINKPAVACPKDHPWWVSEVQVR